MIPKRTNTAWIPISRSLKLLFTRKRLVGISFLLFASTALLTVIMYQLSVSFVDGLTSHYLSDSATSTTILGWLQVQAMHVVKWLYLIFSRVAAFYLAFVLAYTLTSPGYVILSTSAEKLQAGNDFEQDDGFTVNNFVRDLVEGFKIGLIGLIITPIILLVNFVPILGQAAGFLLFTFYSALMFVDYPSSRRRWRLGQKFKWIMGHPKAGLRLGLMPALVSMIPVVNIFFMAILFPLLTIHTTLNFTVIESEKSKQVSKQVQP